MSSNSLLSDSVIKERVLGEITKLLEVYSFEEILFEDDMTLELALYLLVTSGFLELPENEPLD